MSTQASPAAEPALSVHERFWLDHRADIIGALAYRGLQIMSNRDSVWISGKDEFAEPAAEPVLREAPDRNARLCDEITGYLATGGLFNPEMANHDAVRDLLIECRAALAREPVALIETAGSSLADPISPSLPPSSGGASNTVGAARLPGSEQ